ncbi:MAG: DUF5803 family protein [Halorientalis sp.]
MRRRWLAVGALALLAVLAGCSAVLGPGQPDAEQIRQNATYDWTTSANVTVDLRTNEYTAVYVVDNRTEMELYRRDALGSEYPLDVRGLQFQFTNGTVRNVSVANVSLTRDRAIVDLPARNGKLAFTVPRNGKSWSTPTFVDGSYDVTLPPNTRVGVPLLAQVSPDGYTTELVDNRVTISWDDVETDTVSVRWYLVRDLWLFGGLVVVALVVGAGGLLYYLRQIRALERQREEVGLDVDVGDDRDGPPPGMG